MSLLRIICTRMLIGIRKTKKDHIFIFFQVSINSVFNLSIKLMNYCMMHKFL